MGLGNGMEEGVREIWPESDLEMMEFTVDQYIDKQPFSIYYMTVSGHCRYNFWSGNKMSSKNKDLVQHLDSVAVHRGSLEHYPVHTVRSVEKSFLRRMYGEEFSVNSCHHQGIKTLGKGLVPTAFAGDLIEAFEHETLPIFAVQWHPEKMCYKMRREDACDGAALFEYFLKLCEGKKRGL